MTAVREAIVVPCLFLTVALLGGLRVAQDVRLVEPPLVSLVLALLLIAALIRAGALRPDRLMSQRRTALENVNGGVLLVTLFAATAQVFTLLIPDQGLLNVLVSAFFGVQILTTLAAVREREAMLRSVTVLLGCAFVLRFIALESLYSPGRGLMKRVMTALMEGITLGALDYQPTGAVTGYVAFVALAVYLLGLLLIGAESRRDEVEGLPAVRTVPTTLVVKALLLPVLWSTTGCADHERPANNPAPPALVSHAERNARLATARVWMPPEIPVGGANLGENPKSPLSFRASDAVTCRFVAQEVHGTTPKFNCELPGGEVVKIKYGTKNPELFAEVAATRLLAALGFGADRMYLVDKVHCRGCPRLPFQAMQCHVRTGLATACFAGGLDYDRSLTFSPAVIEQPIDGAKIEAVERQGWAWYELDAVDADKGGSPRAHVDAVRLMAMVLAHWDNKAENQRLICRSAGGGCDPVLALMQDLGATFGPAKVDLLNWRRVPVWKDPRTCTVSMETLPAGGATYPEQRISEEGRVFLLGLLDQLTPSQLSDLFASSGIVRTRSIPAESRDAGAWVRAFTDKVRQIRDAGPCPSA